MRALNRTYNINTVPNHHIKLSIILERVSRGKTKQTQSYAVTRKQ